MRELLYKIKINIMYMISSIMTVLNGEYSSSKKAISSFRNRYEGKSCFVIGNGPSLRPEDLDILNERGIVTFASNKIYKIFDKTSWRPTFYAMVDESVADKDCIDSNNEFSCEAKFFRRQGWYIYRKIKNGIYINSWHARKYLENPSFATELSEGVYTIATVTYVLIQLARYMGFSEIYLLGMDNRYKFGMDKEGNVFRNENVVSYFGEEDSNVEIPRIAPATWELDCVYEYAEKYSKENGFRIYNATRGGYLEKFERVDFDKLINQL